MLPLDKSKHNEYCEKMKIARGKQDAPFAKGSKFSNEHKLAMSQGCKESQIHKSKHQNGADNPNYKGGTISKNGYRVINKDKKQYFENRLIMEKIIGRPLTLKETVHHKNGDRLDNRQENLELWNSRQPKGQRVQDKIDWALSLLREYGVNSTFTCNDIAMSVGFG